MLKGIVDIDRSLPLSLSEQIYRHVRLAVRDGKLPAGYKLPSSRVFSGQLGVSRNVVTQAYELLKSEMIIHVRTGSVPTIANIIEFDGLSTADKVPNRQSINFSQRGQSLASNSREGIRAKTPGILTPGVPALDIFPKEDWARCLRRVSRSPAPSDVLYQNVSGLPQLKAVLATYLAEVRGIVAEPENILITSSTQAALTVLSLCLANPRDHVVIENPGYLGAKESFLAAQLNIQPIDVDESGARAPHQFISPAPKLIYLTPSHQFPLGHTMALSRRLAFIDFARTTNAIILEDDYDSEFLFSNRPVASMQGLAPDSVIYLGTFAKTMLPGLRLAYMVVPNNVIEPLSQVIRNMGVMASAPVQSAMANFIASGQYRSHLRTARQTYKARGEALAAKLVESFGNDIDVILPSGGVQLTVKFNQTIDDIELAQSLHNRGVNVSPLSSTYLEHSVSGLIIGYAEATPKDIARGVSLIREAYNAHRSNLDRKSIFSDVSCVKHRRN